MSEPTPSRVWGMGAWLSMPALMGIAYFGAYYATIVPVETRIRIRSGSTRVVRLDEPEPTYTIRLKAGIVLPTGIWRKLFVPAWHVDRAVRPGVWGVNRTDRNR